MPQFVNSYFAARGKKCGKCRKKRRMRPAAHSHNHYFGVVSRVGRGFFRCLGANANGSFTNRIVLRAPRSERRAIRRGCMDCAVPPCSHRVVPRCLRPRGCRVIWLPVRLYKHAADIRRCRNSAPNTAKQQCDFAVMLFLSRRNTSDCGSLCSAQVLQADTWTAWRSRRSS